MMTQWAPYDVYSQSFLAYPNVPILPKEGIIASRTVSSSMVYLQLTCLLWNILSDLNDFAFARVVDMANLKWRRSSFDTRMKTTVSWFERNNPWTMWWESIGALRRLTCQLASHWDYESYYVIDVPQFQMVVWSYNTANYLNTYAISDPYSKTLHTIPYPTVPSSPIQPSAGSMSRGSYCMLRLSFNLNMLPQTYK